MGFLLLCRCTECVQGYGCGAQAACVSQHRITLIYLRTKTHSCMDTRTSIHPSTHSCT
ncbi:hypothetical protein EJ02DRAFT_438943, partial [Clathrospora elynae]